MAPFRLNLCRNALLLVALAFPAAAFALHDPGAAAGEAPGWNFEPWLAALLVASALLYARGVASLWRKAGTGRAIRVADAARFALGWLALAGALLSPLDTLAARSFGIHMVQHELMMVVAAPLLVLARPLEAWAWALPAGARGAVAALARTRLLRRLWGWLTEPAGAWCFHALALWLWHLPALFAAALVDPRLHVLQHVFFFAAALAFWWSVLGGRARAPGALPIASLLTTMLHTGALGALLTFAPAPLYSSALQHPALGLTALEDQQLGGLVMWVPGGLAYLVAALALVGRWLWPDAARRGDLR